MVYQAVVIGEDFTSEKIEQMREIHLQEIICFKQCGEFTSQETMKEPYDETIPEDWRRETTKQYIDVALENYGFESEDRLHVNRGTLLEVRKQSDFFELHILLAGNQVKYIHSKNIILTTYDKIKENKIISLYEVLWAAGVGLDSITLLPFTNENQETLIKGMYFLQGKRAV